MTVWDNRRTVDEHAAAGDFGAAADEVARMARSTRSAMVVLISEMRRKGRTWAEISEVLTAAADRQYPPHDFWPGTSTAALNRQYGGTVNQRHAREIADRAPETSEIRQLRERFEQARPDEWSSRQSCTEGRRLLVTQWRSFYDDATPTEQRLLRDELDALRRHEVASRWEPRVRVRVRDDGVIERIKPTDDGSDGQLVDFDTTFRRFGAPDTTALEELRATFTNWPEDTELQDRTVPPPRG